MAGKGVRACVRVDVARVFMAAYSEKGGEGVGLDIYCREDVACAIRSVDAAMFGTAAHLGADREGRAYITGYRDALVAVGLAFGLDAALPDKALVVATCPALVASERR
jgi:hypothetical protein